MSRPVVRLLVLLLLISAGNAAAHPAHMASGLVTIAGDGSYRVRLTVDVLAYALNDTSERVGDAEMNKLLDGPTDDLKAAVVDARDRLGRGVKLTTDAGAGVTSAVTFPTPEQILADAAKRPREQRLPVAMEIGVDGRLPTAAHHVVVRLPEILGTVVLTVERPGDEPAAIAMEPGRQSDTVDVHLSPAGTTRPVSRPAAESPRTAVTFFQFIRLGFEHIIPEGTDHILFVLGLFLLSADVRPLLWQVTAFTVAHSITLGLAMYGVVRLSPAIVEPLIALSIAFVAVENLFTSKLHPWRPAVVFCFGLIHGMGFAGVLRELTLPRGQFVPALVGFNAGVECGQLAVITAAMLAVGWFRRRPWYRSRMAIPASVLIAARGLYWTVQRIFWP